MCVCWSPDGQYVLTGGQDDLVSIWSLTERRIVARCPGHHSWVTAVAFDPWRCDDRNYRFGSVGEDCRLLLWDFNVGMLHRPKAVSPMHYSRRTLSAILKIVGIATAEGQCLIVDAVSSSSHRKPGHDPTSFEFEPDHKQCGWRRIDRTLRGIKNSDGRIAAGHGE